LGESGEALTPDFSGAFTWATAVAGFAETVVVFACAVAVVTVVFVVDTAPALATPTAIGLLGAATTVTGFGDEPTLAFPVAATFVEGVEGAEGFVVATFTVAGLTETAEGCANPGFAVVVGEGFAFA
jgi:hypothetical protein